MDYAEQPPPAGLEDRVAACWTLRCEGNPTDTLRHRVAPDGCLELIFRDRGCSRWGGEQPSAFVAGMITAPAELQMSGDARFSAVRLWPWAWNAMGSRGAPGLVNSWMPLDQAMTDGFRSVDEALDRIAAAPLGSSVAAIGTAALAATSVQVLSQATTLSHRTLQRWFAREIGVPPRLYLRLVRFNQALAAIQVAPDTLSSVAAEQGYADQAHMARDFRQLAGQPAQAARSRARGPFL